MGNKADNKSMNLQGDYFTRQEMSDILGIPTNTIKKRILTLGIKAIIRDALYTSSDFEKIKNTAMGRPKKEKPAPDKKPVMPKKKK